MKYTAKNDELHLIDILKKKYLDITIDWSGRIFIGIHLDWEYTKRTVTLSIPNYVNKYLSIFKHKKPKHDQHSPHPHVTPKYGPKTQYTPSSTTSNLTESQIIYFRQVIGAFLFYACAMDSTIITTVGSIATHLSTSKWDSINNRINHFLEYAATHPDAKVSYHKIDMHIWVYIDASYLTEPKSKSQAGGYQYSPNFQYNLTTHNQNITTMYFS